LPVFFTVALKRDLVAFETVLLPALKAIAPAVAVLVPCADVTVVAAGVVATGVVAAGAFEDGVLGEGAEGAAATVTTAAFEVTDVGVFDPAVFVTTTVNEPASESTTEGIK
jgi:hypothetical protein